MSSSTAALSLASTATLVFPSCPLLIVPEHGPSRPQKDPKELLDIPNVYQGIPMMGGVPSFLKVPVDEHSLT